MMLKTTAMMMFWFGATIMARSK